MRIAEDVKRWWTTLESVQRNMIKVTSLFVLAVFCSAAFVIPSNWQRSEWLSLWQVLVTALGFPAAVYTIYYAARQFRYGRQRDEDARERSLSLIKQSLKTELQTNRKLLGGKYKIWSEEEPETRESHAIGVKPLKLHAFELVRSREDFKLLEPAEAISKIIEAYSQIEDFNSVLQLWFERALRGQDKERYSRLSGKLVNLAALTAGQLDIELKDTRTKVDEALKALGSD